MSMYHLVFGTHPAMPVAVALLGKERMRNLGRFRDAWFEQWKDGLRIHVYARNGGNNREDCMPDLTDDPLFIEDKDDAFDSTYASLYFRVPDGWKQTLMSHGAPEDFEVGECAMDPIDTGRRWQAMLDRLQGD